MKKKIVIVMGIVLVILIVLVIWKNYHDQKKKQLDEEYRIQVMYYNQNCAFNIGNVNFDERKIYHSSDELDLKWTVLSLQAYNTDQVKYELILKDVVEYLDSEYAEDGTLMISSQPEAINDYIVWYCLGGGSEKTRHFISTFNKYLRDNGYAEYYTDISVEELQSIIIKMEQDLDQ